MRQELRKLVAEGIGTFALVFLGAGAVIVESHTGISHMGLPDGKVGLAGIALTHGLTLAAMIFAFGSVSGAHFNPAVSVAMWMREKLSSEHVVGYIAAQLVGAVVAGVFLLGLFPDEVRFAALGTPALGARIGGLQGVAIEAVITFLLTTSILFVTRAENSERQFGAIAIGGTLTAAIFFAGPLTGGAANPARFLGPALASGHLAQIATYTVGPLVGAGAAAFVFGLFSDLPQTGDEALREPEPAPSGGATPGFGRDRSGSRRARAEATIRQAHVLLRRGSPQTSAALLAPLLAALDDHEPPIAHRIRTLALVIEEEHGPLDPFAEFRQRLWPSGHSESAAPAE